MIMVLGGTSTSWAGNVVDDNGNCSLKIMTTAGEFTSLPTTNFKGSEVYLVPANAEIWVASDGSTANSYTMAFSIQAEEKNLINDGFNYLALNKAVSGTTARAIGYEHHPWFDFDTQYPLFEETENAASYIYYLEFYDVEDGSYMGMLYLLDDGSYPITQKTIEAGWKLDSIGWWYQNADGSYPKSAWQMIDNKYYYFNEAGYMLADTTTPDGYQVDESGAWIQAAFN